MSESFSNNPMLLNPLNNGQNTVPPLAGPAKALPVVLLPEARHFVCSMLNHHMTRSDGKRLAFIFGICKTNDKYDVEYFQNEINSGNPYIREASEKEVEVYGMKMDPKGTMTRQITPQIEARVRQELEIELRNSFEEKLNSIGIVLTDEQRAAMQRKEQESVAAETDSDKLKNTDVTSLLRARMTASVRDGGATVGPVGPVLGGIVGTDKIVNSAESISK